MRSLIKKWGEAGLAVLCVLAIVFAALYTRQDDLRRMAARSAESSQDQTLSDAQAETVWRPPVPQEPRLAFSAASRNESGLWQFSPWISYPSSFGQYVCAMQAGTVTYAAADTLYILHGNGIETRYRGLRELRARAGDSVAAGQALGTAESDGFFLCALREDAYIDPLSLLP